jgi:hypothetical protein
MNQDQEEIRKSDINKPIQLNVTALKEPGDGHPGNEMQEIAKENHYGKGIAASSVSEGSRVSERPLVKDTAVGPEVAQGVDAEKTVEEKLEAPTKTEELDLSSYIEKPAGTDIAAQDDKQAMPETTPEIGGGSLIGEEKFLAQELAKSTDGELLINPSIGEKDIESDTIALEEGQETSNLDDSMNTQETEIPTKKIATPEVTADVFDSTELKSIVENVKSIKEDIAMVQKELDEEINKIEKVQVKVGILPVNENLIKEANQKDLEKYQGKLTEKKSKLQEQINELQELIQSNPEALIALSGNTEVEAIPEIKTLLDSTARVNPATKVELVNPEAILASKEVSKIKSAEAIIQPQGHPGTGLVKAIGDAINELNPELSNEELVEKKGKVFGEFTRNILNDLKTSSQSHKDVVNEYKAMVQALEASNGIIEVVLGEDGEMSAHIKDNTSETIMPTDVADDYNYQVAA